MAGTHPTCKHNNCEASKPNAALKKNQKDMGTKKVRGHVADIVNAADILLRYQKTQTT